MCRIRWRRKRMWNMKPLGRNCRVSIRPCILVAVFVAGVAGNSPIALAQSVGTFTPTGSMTVVRTRAEGTLLANGQVLIVGGGSADLYQPGSGTFTAIATMPNRLDSPTATLL